MHSSVCIVELLDSYFKASFYTVLGCILYKKVKCIFFVYTFLKFCSELVAGWLALCWYALFLNTTPVHV